MSKRPEHTAPPEIFYDDSEAKKYTGNSRIAAIQTALSERALELLALPDDGVPRLLLDLGCGSCLSSDAITEAGHAWVVRGMLEMSHAAGAQSNAAQQGLDISQAMLEVAGERGLDGDTCLSDLGQGLPVRGGCFDGAISISAVQWLCNADTATADPLKRLRRFFDSLYGSLVRGARAVLQMYPENAKQAELLTSAAMRAGFSGGLVVDFPNSAKAKKYFLVLMVGQPAEPMDLQGLDGEQASTGVAVVGRQKGGGGRTRHRKGSVGHAALSARHPESKGKAWIHRKKTAMRAKGYLNVPHDSKYTGRKRKTRF